MKEPLFLTPYFREKIWGGNKLKTTFHLDIPSDHTGEAWVISAHPNGPSTVTAPAAYAGLTLKEVYAKYPELFGPNHPEPFPLLIKILDATADLSVQVHPDDAYAKAHENPGELGKTECWYIISAEPEAKIIYGHHAASREEFAQYVENGDFKHLFREIPVKTGDFFDVPAGTIHAIGSGITILETQQSSDTTYRVYDYERKDASGQQRELHLKQAMDVTLFPHEDSSYTQQNLHVEENTCHLLMENNYFSVYKLDVTAEVALPLKSMYYLATVVAGEGEMVIADKIYPLTLADSFVLPYDLDQVTFLGNLSLILSHPHFVE